MSQPAPIRDNLCGPPDVFFSPRHQRPNDKASLLFCSRRVTGYASY